MRPGTLASAAARRGGSRGLAGDGWPSSRLSAARARVRRASPVRSPVAASAGTCETEASSRRRTRDIGPGRTRPERRDHPESGSSLCVSRLRSGDRRREKWRRRPGGPAAGNAAASRCPVSEASPPRWPDDEGQMMALWAIDHLRRAGYNPLVDSIGVRRWSSHVACFSLCGQFKHLHFS